MIEFGREIYYIDINAFDKAITPNGYKPTDKIITTEKRVTRDANGIVVSTEDVELTQDRGKEIDTAKYDVLRTMVEILIDYEDDADASLGADRALDKTPLSYKIAFNTLLNYGILKQKG